MLPSSTVRTSTSLAVLGILHGDVYMKINTQINLKKVTIHYQYYLGGTCWQSHQPRGPEDDTNPAPHQNHLEKGMIPNNYLECDNNYPHVSEVDHQL